MHYAQRGDRVRVTYHWPISEKAASDVTTCEFTVGTNEAFEALSLGVVGMSPGDRKRIAMSAREAQSAGRASPDERASPADISGKARAGRRVYVVDRRSGQRRQATIVTAVDRDVVLRYRTPLSTDMASLEILLVSLAPSGRAKASRPRFDLGGEG